MLSGANTKRLSRQPTREQPTYSWPWEKHCVSRFRPTTFRVWPCALFMDIAKEIHTGNWKRLKSNGMLEGMTGILGMNTSVPAPGPAKMVASSTLGIICLTTNCVPLHSVGTSRFLSNMIGHPIFNFSLCGGTPDGWRELRRVIYGFLMVDHGIYWSVHFVPSRKLW